jgi:hypothetical protein
MMTVSKWAVKVAGHSVWSDTMAGHRMAGLDGWSMNGWSTKGQLKQYLNIQKCKTSMCGQNCTQQG